MNATYYLDQIHESAPVRMRLTADSQEEAEEYRAFLRRTKVGDFISGVAPFPARVTAVDADALKLEFRRASKAEIRDYQALDRVNQAVRAAFPLQQKPTEIR